MIYLENAESMLDEIIGIYGESGIDISYRPKLVPVYGDENHPYEFVSCDLRGLPEINEMIFGSIDLVHRLYKGFPNSEFPPKDKNKIKEVFIEFTEKMSSEIERIEKIFDEFIDDDFFGNKPDKSDLYLHENFRKLRSDEMRFLYLSHNFWHLVELQNRVLGSSLIIEGTANYATAESAGKMIDEDTKPHNIWDAVNRYPAIIARRKSLASPNPYKQMLDPNFRNEVQGEFIKHLINFIVDNDYTL